MSLNSEGLKLKNNETCISFAYHDRCHRKGGAEGELSIESLYSVTAELALLAIPCICFRHSEQVCSNWLLFVEVMGLFKVFR